MWVDNEGNVGETKSSEYRCVPRKAGSIHVGIRIKLGFRGCTRACYSHAGFYATSPHVSPDIDGPTR